MPIRLPFLKRGDQPPTEFHRDAEQAIAQLQRLRQEERDQARSNRLRVMRVKAQVGGSAGPATTFTDDLISAVELVTESPVTQFSAVGVNSALRNSVVKYKAFAADSLVEVFIQRDGTPLIMTPEQFDTDTCA